MTTQEIRKILADPAILKRQAFSVLSEINRMHTREPDHPDVQELVLRALEKSDLFDGVRPALFALARERGLFPYLEE